jgi:NAD-dependent DNA ligase
MNATEACIALNMLPTVGPVRLRKLLEVFKEPQQILAAKRTELRKVEGIGNEVADQIANWEATVDLAEELRRVRDFGATVIAGVAIVSPSLRDPCATIVLWLGRTAGASSRHRDHRRATHHALRHESARNCLSTAPD